MVGKKDRLQGRLKILKALEARLMIRLETKKAVDMIDGLVKLREPDLNRRPRGYEPRELPSCSIPRGKRYPIQCACLPQICFLVFFLKNLIAFDS